jgi:hypothetical protein
LCRNCKSPFFDGGRLTSPATAAPDKNNIYIHLTDYSPLMNTMRFPYLACLTASLVVLLLLCAACTSGPSGNASVAGNTTTTVNVGIVPIPATGTGQQVSYTLEDAASAVAENYNVQGNGSLQTPPFYYIRGENVDASGRAGRWIFGTSEGNGTVMLVYDSNGVERISFNGGGVPGPEIDITGILSPADAIKTAYPAARNTTGSFDIEIMNGEYTITGPAGSPSHEYIINATTGVLRANQD